MKRVFRKTAVSIARTMLSPIYSGIGSILCLHRVVEPVAGPRIKTNVALEISTASLEQLIVYLLEQRVRIISLDEVYDILKSGKRAGRFLAFTFDDGYLDNCTLAYSIFKKFKAPFAVNVTTSFVSNPDRVWWYRLEQAMFQHERIVFFDSQGRNELRTVSQEEKQRAFDLLCDVIRQFGAARREDFVRQLFQDNATRANSLGRLMMDWQDIKKLSGDALVTIGAHSVSHYDFSKLPDAEVLFELNESRRVIESQIGRKVEHFAYPFGGRSAVGPREFALARSCGFKTVVTTRNANLFRGHAAYLECLPRIGTSGNYPTLPRFKLVHSGALAAFQRGFKRVVTH